jgi:hypothetical protein
MKTQSDKIVSPHHRFSAIITSREVKRLHERVKRCRARVQAPNALKQKSHENDLGQV